MAYQPLWVIVVALLRTRNKDTRDELSEIY